MSSVVQDARLAIRALRRAPTFTTASVLIVGLAIGTSTAMFTVFRAVLIEQLPVSQPERLVVLRSLNRGTTKGDPAGTVITDLQRNARNFSGVAGVYHLGSVLIPYRDAERDVTLNGCAVTSNFFDVLGVRPVLGRFLRPEDGAAGAQHVMVISYRAWQQQFGGDLNVVGHRLFQPGAQWNYTIVGVAPPGLDYPSHVDDWQPESPNLTRIQ